jgi:hypothetical protein
MSTLPLVSIVIPCYNYGRYLPGAVASALEQQGVDLEVVIVDDASTDGSNLVAFELANQDARIRVVQHPHNRGHIATYNDGLAFVNGEYVVLLSADDMLAPGALKRSTDLMRANPSVGLVYGYAPEFSDRPPAQLTTRVRNRVWSGERWLQRICDRGTNLIVNPEAILRRDIMEALIGYSAELPQTADMELWMRAAVLTDVGRVGGPHQAYYRVHDASMHLTDFCGLLTEITARRDTFTEFFENAGAELPRAAERLASAYRTLALEAMRLARSALNGTGTLGNELADGFVAFAAETWPEVSSTWLWRDTQRRRLRPAGALRRAAEARAAGLTGALRWRRWRRFGV